MFVIICWFIYYFVTQNSTIVLLPVTVKVCKYGPIRSDCKFPCSLFFCTCKYPFCTWRTSYTAELQWSHVHSISSYVFKSALSSSLMELPLDCITLHWADMELFKNEFVHCNWFEGKWMKAIISNLLGAMQHMCCCSDQQCFSSSTLLKVSVCCHSHTHS